MSKSRKSERELCAKLKALNLIEEFEITKKNKMLLLDGYSYVLALDVFLNPCFPVGFMAVDTSKNKKIMLDSKKKGCSGEFILNRVIMGKYAIYIKENYLNLNLETTDEA